MTLLAGAATAAASFAAAAWLGVRAAAALCAGRVPDDEGPRAVAFARWPFPLAGACAGAALALHGATPQHLGVLAFVVFALAGCTAADLACGMLLDALTLGPLALVVGAGLLARDAVPLLGALLVAVPFAAAAACTHGCGMGWGDVKLAALGGALLGARDAALAFLLAAVAAYVVARRSGSAARPIAFGPYLAASIAVTLAALTRG